MLSYQIDANYDQITDKFDYKIQNQLTTTTYQLPKSNIYIYPVLYNPYLLQNSQQHHYNLISQLFNNKIIKTIQKKQHYLTINLIYKTKSSKFVGYLFRTKDHYTYKKLQYYNQYWNSQQHLSSLPTKQHQLHQLNKNDKQQYQWMQKMKSKSIITWLISSSQLDFKIKNISISNQMINLLNYKPDQFVIDLINFNQQTFEYCMLLCSFIGDHVYKSTCLTIINTVKKIYQMKIYGNFKKQDLIKQSQKYIIHQIKGRGHKKITVQTKIYMISDHILCHEVVRVLSHREVKDHQRMVSRQQAFDKIQQNSYASLQSVVRMPKVSDPSNADKICGYVEIPSEESIENKNYEENKTA